MAGASLRARLLALVLAPALVLGAAEVCLRILGYRYDAQAALTGGKTYEELEESRLYVPDPELIWKLRPSSVLDASGPGFLQTHTNSLGLRGEEIPEGNGSPRILCLGDSITFGLGLEDADAYPVRLAEAIGHLRASPPREAQVVNGGVPGWSSVQGLRLLNRLRSWDPDFVVFWFGINDAKAARGLPDPQQFGAGGALSCVPRALQPFRTYQLLQQILLPTPRPDPEARRVSVAEFAAAARTIAEEWEDRAIFIRCPDRLEQTIAEYRMMIADAERAGVDTIVGPNALISPWTPAEDGTDLTVQAALVEDERVIAYDPGIADTRTSLDTLRDDLPQLLRLKSDLEARLATLPPDAMDYDDLFDEAAPGQVFRDNCHLNPHGTSLAARAIAERILRTPR